METYRNVSGKSHVKEYEIGEDFIVVRFTEPGNSGYDTYKYTYESAGEENVEQMKQMAEAGQGLTEFINTEVRKKYESRS